MAEVAVQSALAGVGKFAIEWLDPSQKRELQKVVREQLEAAFDDQLRGSASQSGVKRARQTVMNAAKDNVCLERLIAAALDDPLQAEPKWREELREALEGESRGRNDLTALDDVIDVDGLLAEAPQRIHRAITDQVTRPRSALRPWWDNVQHHRTQALVTAQQTAIDPAKAGIDELRKRYRKAFAGQQQALDFLDGFLGREEQHALLLQETGRGKTALLVHWVDRLLDRHEAPVVFVPIHRRYVIPESASPARVVLGSLLVQLAACHGQTVNDADLDPERARPLIAELLRKNAPRGGRLVVVVDGLDEAVGFSFGPDVLPGGVGEGVKVVVSARQQARMNPSHWLHRLGWEEVPVTQVPRLSPLTGDEVRDVVEQLWAPANVQPTQQQLDQVIRVSEGDPLMVQWVANDLRGGKMTAEELSTRPSGLSTYFEDALQRDGLGEVAAESSAARALLGCCAAALGPLTAEDLAALQPEVLGARASVNQAAQSLGRFLVGDGSTDAGFAFNYPRLSELYWEEQLNDRERSDLARRFVDYGKRWWSDRRTPLPWYIQRFWPSHLAVDGEWDLLREVLTSYEVTGQVTRQPWAAARYAAEGHYSGYLTDLEVLWRHSEEQGDLVTAFTCSLISATTNSISAGLSPELIAALVGHGTSRGPWSVTDALEHIRRIPDSGMKADALASLGDSTNDWSWPWEPALDVARAITDEGARAYAMATVVPMAPPNKHGELMAEALRAARAITDPAQKAKALTSLVPVAPQERRGGMVEEALEHLKGSNSENSSAVVLADIGSRLGSHLSDHSLAEALHNVAWAVGEVPEGEQGQLVGRALRAARLIRTESARAQALVALVPSVPEDERRPLVEEVLAAAVRRDHGENAGGMLQLVAAGAASVPETDRSALVEEALMASRDISRQGERAEALTGLVLAAPEGQRGELVEEALGASRSIVAEGRRSDALADMAYLLGLLPDDELTGLAEKLLEEVRSISDAWARSRVLVPLAQQAESAPMAVREKLLETAQAAVRSVTDPGRRSQGLVALVSVAPEETRAALVEEALVAARALADEPAWAEAVASLVPAALESERGRLVEGVLAAARAASERQSRLRILNAVTSAVASVPESYRQQLIEGVLEAGGSAADGGPEPPVLQAAMSGVASLPEDDRGHLVEALLATARSITDAGDQAEAFVALTPLVQGEDRRALANQALEAAKSTTDDGSRTNVLMKLSTVVQVEEVQGLAKEALSAARLIASDQGLANVLISWLSTIESVTASRRGALVEEALTAGSRIVHEPARVEFLMALASAAASVPARHRGVLVEKVVEDAQRLDDTSYRAKVLETLASRLALRSEDEVRDSVQMVMAAASRLTDTPLRERIFSLLVPAVAYGERDTLVERVLADSRTYASDSSRVQVLEPLASAVGALRDEERRALVERVLEEARSLTRDDFRMRVLKALAPSVASLREKERGGVVDEVWSAARIVTDAPSQFAMSLWARVSEALVLTVPESDRSRLLREMLTTADSMTHEATRVEVLKAVSSAVASAPEDERSALTQELLAATRPITDWREKAFHAVTSAVKSLPEVEREALIDEVLAASGSHSNQHLRLQVLIQLAPYGSKERKQRFLTEILRLLSMGERPEFLKTVEKVRPLFTDLTDQSDVHRIAEAVRDNGQASW